MRNCILLFLRNQYQKLLKDLYFYVKHVDPLLTLEEQIWISYNALQSFYGNFVISGTMLIKRTISITSYYFQYLPLWLGGLQLFKKKQISQKNVFYAKLILKAFWRRSNEYENSSPGYRQTDRCWTKAHFSSELCELSALKDVAGVRIDKGLMSSPSLWQH